MKKLLHGEKIIVNSLEVAESFVERAVGLLNRTDMSPDEALWIKKCNSIHTFGMRFSIDCVFVDKNLCIVDILYSIKPYRMAWPRFKASSVIEFKTGNQSVASLKIGDELYVGT